MDLKGLRLVGFIYGGVFAAVTLIAFTVVFLHVEGQLTLDETPAAVAMVQ